MPPYIDLSLKKGTFYYSRAEDFMSPPIDRDRYAVMQAATDCRAQIVPPSPLSVAFPRNKRRSAGGTQPVLCEGMVAPICHYLFTV